MQIKRNSKKKVIVKIEIVQKCLMINRSGNRGEVSKRTEFKEEDKSVAMKIFVSVV